MKKIGFIASSGGHYEQLMMLQPLMKRHSSFIMTEKTMYKTKSNNQKKYLLLQINRRELSFLFKFLYNAVLSLLIFFKENPDIIISTGALSTIPMSIYAKLFNKKLIFIESFAKVDSGTVTGKLMYHLSDKFYIQWKKMEQVYPNAKYIGSIY